MKVQTTEKTRAAPAHRRWHRRPPGASLPCIEKSGNQREKAMTRKAWIGLSGVAALGLLFVSAAAAQQAAPPVVEYMVPDGYATPQGMQLGCMANPVSGGA